MSSKEAIRTKTIELSPYPNAVQKNPIIPPINDNSDKPSIINPLVESQFHIYKKPVENSPQMPSLLSPSDSIHSTIQTSWAAFGGMSDKQRNHMLKGILTKCSSKQIDYICTLLNLKIVGDGNKSHV